MAPHKALGDSCPDHIPYRGTLKILVASVRCNILRVVVAKSREVAVVISRGNTGKAVKTRTYVDEAVLAPDGFV